MPPTRTRRSGARNSRPRATSDLEHFDALETRDPAEREAELLRACRADRHAAAGRAPRWRAHARRASIRRRSRAARRSRACRSRARPSCSSCRRPRRHSAGSGPAASRRLGAALHVARARSTNPKGAPADIGRRARALRRGFRAGDLVHNCFRYHLTPGGFIVNSGARASAARCFPAGAGTDEHAASRPSPTCGPTGYAGTPSFLKILLERPRSAASRCRRLLKRAWVSGEAFPPLRASSGARHRRLPELRHGRPRLHRLRDAARGRLVVDEDVIVEIVRPGTGDPVAEGEVGEVVVTRFNPDYPLVRFGTGDLSAVLPGASPAAAPTRASRAGWAAPTRPPRCGACSCTRSRSPRSARRHPEVPRPRLVVSGEMANDDP